MPRVMTMASSLHGMARKFHGKIDHTSSKFLFLLPNYVSTHTADLSCCEANCTATGLCHNFFQNAISLCVVFVYSLSQKPYSVSSENIIHFISLLCCCIFPFLFSICTRELDLSANSLKMNVFSMMNFVLYDVTRSL